MCTKLENWTQYNKVLTFIIINRKVLLLDIGTSSEFFDKGKSYTPLNIFVSVQVPKYLLSRR